MIIPAFQVIQFPKNGVVGAEVIARWRYKDKLLSPLDFQEKGPVNWASVDLEIIRTLIALTPTLGKVLTPYVEKLIEK